MKVNLLIAGKYIIVFIFGIICGLFIKQQKSNGIDGVPKTEALEIKGAGESSVYGIVGNIKNTLNTRYVKVVFVHLLFRSVVRTHSIDSLG